MSIIDVNQRLLKIFGLEGQCVTSLTVHTAVNEIPTLTIKRNLIDPGDVLAIEQVFDLQLRQETAAQSECEAMARVNAWIDAEADKCIELVSAGFSNSWDKFDINPWRYGRTWARLK